MIIGFITEMLNTMVKSLDNSLKNTPAHQIVLGTAALYFLYNQYNDPWISRLYRSRHDKTPKQRILDVAYELCKNLPGIKPYIDEELKKNQQSTEKKLILQRSEMFLQNKMPEKGQSPAKILKEFNIDIKKCSFNFQSIKEDDEEKQFIIKEGDGKDSGALYAVHPKELKELLKEVYGETALSNPMHDKWPRISAMQAEIISWCQELFHGSNEGYGLLTHGGTTSIIEAMAAYVIETRARGIGHPEIVVPETAHAAFKKAAELTGATLIIVPVNKNTGAVTADKMGLYLSKNTAVIIGSAPSFMNGICDPISELGALAKERNIPFHVDACLGGFITAFTDTSKNPMDFQVPGVTSISADFHKYGCCPKGTSVCLFSKDSPALSVFSALNWPGGLYATAGILDGSTSGARVAEIYATMSYYGRERYEEIAKNIITLRQSIQEAVTKLHIQSDAIDEKDVYIYGDPQFSVLGFRSDNLNSHFIAYELEQRGWKLNFLQNPNGFHLCLTHVHSLDRSFEATFISHLEEAIKAVKLYPKDKKIDGNVKIYGVVELMPTKLQKKIGEQYQNTRLNLFFQAESEFEKINDEINNKITME